MYSVGQNVLLKSKVKAEEYDDAYRTPHAYGDAYGGNIHRRA